LANFVPHFLCRFAKKPYLCTVVNLDFVKYCGFDNLDFVKYSVFDNLDFVNDET